MFGTNKRDKNVAMCKSDYAKQLRATADQERSTTENASGGSTCASTSSVEAPPVRRSRQRDIRDMTDQVAHNRLDYLWAAAVAENDLAFNVSKSKSIQAFVDAVIMYAKPYTLPTPYKVSGPIAGQAEGGLRGPAAAAEGELEDQRGAITTVRPKHVVQVVMDNASNNKNAASKLSADYPHIFFTNCAAHCLDLMLHDIGKIPAVKLVLSQVHQVVMMIKGSASAVVLFRELFTKLSLVRPGATRFDTQVIMLGRFLEVKRALRAMVISEEWEDVAVARTEEGMEVRKLLLDDVFWDCGTAVHRLMTPIYEVLRVVDTRAQVMGQLYGLMLEATVKTNAAAETAAAHFIKRTGLLLPKDRSTFLTSIKAIIARRWDAQLHNPLHAIGWLLNPHNQYIGEVRNDKEIRKGVDEVIQARGGDVQQRITLAAQVAQFHRGEGRLGSDDARWATTTLVEAGRMTEAEWWFLFGGEVQALQDLAVTTLSQPVTSSEVERYWSALARVQRRDRNRLTAKKMTDVTFVAFTRRARDAFDRKAALRSKLYQDLGNVTLREGAAIIPAEVEVEEGDAEEEAPVEEECTIDWWKKKVVWKALFTNAVGACAEGAHPPNPSQPLSTRLNPSKSTRWKKKVVWKALFTNAVGAIALRALMAACEGGRCGLYSDGGFILFDAQRESDFGLRELLPVLVLGITGGLVGALFNTAVARLAKLRAKYINPYGPWCKVLEAALIAILTSLARMALPFASRCLPCPENEVCPDPSLNGNYIAFTCPAGSYNPMAGLAPTTNDNAITNLFSSSPAQYTHATLAIFFLVFFSLAIITNGCSVPAGLFVPLIVAGGTYGRMMGKLMRSLTSSTSPTLSSFLLPSLTSPLWSAGLLLFGESGSDTGLDEGTYALLGAASLLGGSMRMSVSLSVMLLEVTGNLLLLPLIMLATTIAKEVGDCFNEGVVDEASHLKRLPMLEYPPPEFMKNLTAIDGVRGPAVALKSVERVGEVLRVLQTTTHSAFPVVQIVATREGGKLGEGEKEGVGEGEGEGEVQAMLYGMVLRSKLLKLLADKSAFQRGTLCTARTNPLHKLPLSTNTAAAAAAAAVPEPRAGQRTVRFEGVPVSPQATNGDTPCGTAEGAYAEGLTLGGRLAKSLSHKHRTATAIVNVKKTPCIEDIDLSVEEQDMFLDLHPFCNTSPHVVGEAMSLRKAYAIFRRMGLRHLCVVRERMQVVGVLTRKDLLPHSFEKQQLEEWDDDDSDSDSSDEDEEEEGSVWESGGFARENGGAGVSGGGEGGAAIVDRAVVAVASDGDESGRRGSGHVSDGEGGGRLGSGHASDGEGGVRGTPKRRKRAIPSFISRCHTQKYH
ncbi:unnamed protein product [Closterium sp. NIES-64]|nr:unnamed protein product [Closterium sp. NIES-64]